MSLFEGASYPMDITEIEGPHICLSTSQPLPGLGVCCEVSSEHVRVPSSSLKLLTSSLLSLISGGVN